jgi:elongation factor P
MISVNNLRKGLLVEVEGTVFAVVEYQHHKPGKGHAVVRVKLRNAQTGAVIDRTFNGKEKIALADAQRKKMQYMYSDTEFHFMDQANFEQVALNPDEVGENANYLIEGLEVEILFHSGKALAMELPTSVNLKVNFTEPGLRGDTATNVMKKATLETNYEVDVPLFINISDVVKIDTRTGDYLERVRS